MFSLDFVKTLIELLLTIAIVLQGILLPDPHGSCYLLSQVKAQLIELDDRKKRDGELFPGSAMSFTPTERCKWMSELRHDRPIGQIVWPGTRNSATNKIGIHFLTRPFGQHQQQSIYHQLLHGVRALDVRVQQERFVCSGYLLSYNIDVVMRDITKFLDETENEIIILEIRTERGYTDPPDFDKFLVEQLGDRLIHQDDGVFSKTISQLLPKRIICVWKPNHSPRPKAGGPLWNTNYLKDDEFDIELPLTKIDGNLSNLQDQSPARDRLFFYKVEHTLSTQSRINPTHCLLIWPMILKVVSKRMSGFSRLFLATCHSRGVLDRLQIYSTDFVDDDFVNVCISLNRNMRIIVQGEDELAKANNDKSVWIESCVLELAADLQEGTELTYEQISKLKGECRMFEEMADWGIGDAMRSIGLNPTQEEDELGDMMVKKVQEKLAAALTSHQDQNGFISATQFRSVFKDVLGLVDEDFDERFPEYNANKDHQISYEEVIKHLMADDDDSDDGSD